MRSAQAQVEFPATAPLSAAQEREYLLVYAPLVQRIVSQLAVQAIGTLDRDDMRQIGLLGLLTAIRRYGEPDERFSGYATSCVRGAILDELRRQDWRPRAVRQGAHRARDCVRDLTRRLGREPTRVEIQQTLNLTPEAYHEFQLAQNAEQLASFDEVLQDMHGGFESPEAQLLTRRGIEEALTALGEREQRVVQLYYEYELSLKEIAEVLGLTEARVCQINKAALKKMKLRLQSA